MIVLYWLAVGAIIGFGYEYRYEFWFDVPGELVYGLQLINGINISILILAMMTWRPTMPHKCIHVLNVQGKHAIILTALSPAIFFVIAFYEYFSPTAGFAFALFPCFWLIYLCFEAIRA